MADHQAKAALYDALAEAAKALAKRQTRRPFERAEAVRRPLQQGQPLIFKISLDNELFTG